MVLNGVLRDATINKLSLIKDHSDDPIAWLNDRLVIDYPDDAEILRVAMTGENRDEVVKIVNKIVEVYMKEIVQRERDIRLEHEAKLQRTYQNMTADLQKQQDSLHALEALHNTRGSESAQLKKDMAIEELNNYLGSAHQDHQPDGRHSVASHAEKGETRQPRGSPLRPTTSSKWK